jgi:glycosyltransferase involved in cell wall biosynthesis
VVTQVVNVADAHPSWNWLASRFTNEALVWHACNSHVGPEFAKRLRVPVSRFRAAISARQLLRKHLGRSVVVTHGPYPALYSAAFTQPHLSESLHLAFSFNFANLPTGTRRILFRRYLKRVDRFVIASSVERKLYGEYFDIEPERFEFLIWSMPPPIDECTKPARFGSGRYICAIGSQARDYDTLIETMRRLPSINLVLVASAACLPRVPVPPNVRIMTDVPFADAMNVLAHSVFMVLPLRDSTVPCGHVTMVAAMHMGKAIVATDSSGLHDYLIGEENALLVPHHDSRQLADRVERLFNDPVLCGRLGQEALAFARANCTEDNTEAYFRRFLVNNGLEAPQTMG